MSQTQTRIDVMSLRNQLVNELEAASTEADTLLPLRRDLVEQILHALRHHPHSTRHWDAETLRPSVLNEMRRLSPTGTGVSKGRWNQERNDELPHAQKCCRMLNAQWSELVIEAGLQPNPYSRGGDEYYPTLDDPSEPVSLAPDPLDDDGLAVMSKRIEVREHGHIRTVTEIYTLR